MDAAPSGATIHIAPDASQQIVIGQDLNLRGAGEDATVITSPATITDLHVISTPSAFALHIRLARCDHGRSPSGGGGKGMIAVERPNAALTRKGPRTAWCW